MTTVVQVLSRRVRLPWLHTGQIRLVKTRHDTRYLGNDPVRIILYLTEIQHDSDPIFLSDL